MKPSIFATILAVILFNATLCLAEVVVKNISASPGKRTGGNVWVHLSADVTNTGSNPAGVAIMLEAVGRGGETIKMKSLKGTIPPDSTETLSTSAPVSEEEYKKIVKWRKN